MFRGEPNGPAACDISSSNMAAYERWPRVCGRGTKYITEVCRMGATPVLNNACAHVTSRQISRATDLVHTLLRSQVPCPFQARSRWGGGGEGSGGGGDFRGRFFLCLSVGKIPKRSSFPLPFL